MHEFGVKRRHAAGLVPLAALAVLAISACAQSSTLMTQRVAEVDPEAIVACELPSKARCSNSTSVNNTTYRSCLHIKHVQLSAQTCLDEGGSVAASEYERVIGSAAVQ